MYISTSIMFEVRTYQINNAINKIGILTTNDATFIRVSTQDYLIL